MTYQADLMRNRYAMAALSVGGLQQPELSELAANLFEKDEARFREKNKRMTDDHLKQEAVKWKRARDIQRTEI